MLKIHNINRRLRRQRRWKWFCFEPDSRSSYLMKRLTYSLPHNFISLCLFKWISTVDDFLFVCFFFTSTVSVGLCTAVSYTQNTLFFPHLLQCFSISLNHHWICSKRIQSSSVSYLFNQNWSKWWYCLFIFHSIVCWIQRVIFQVKQMLNATNEKLSSQFRKPEEIWMFFFSQ